MKQIGIEKEIDNAGRILIPKNIRKSLGFELNQQIEMIITSEGLLLRAPQCSIVKKNKK